MFSVVVSQDTTPPYLYCSEDSWACVSDCSYPESCVASSWLGDGICDDNSTGTDLTCYNNDGGDCGPSDPPYCGDMICAENEKNKQL